MTVALLYFGSFGAILVLFGSVIAVIWWLLKRVLRPLGKLIRAMTDE
jgi:nitrate/nitrite-specific signal transduction histidine kinase